MGGKTEVLGGALDEQDHDAEPARRDPVLRAFGLLGTMLDFDGRPFGVRALAEASGLPVSSVYRTLGTMTNAGMVRRHTDGTYDIGFEFFRLAARASVLMPVRRAAQPVLEELADRCGESAVLALYDLRSHKMMIKTYVSSGQPLQYRIELDAWSPIYRGAIGQAILAALSAEELDAAVARHGTDALTDSPGNDRASLDAELARVRERGYAFSIGAGIPGAVAVAAPIWGSAGDLLGDIAIIFPDSRFEPSREKALAAHVQAAAAEVTHRLGSPMASPYYKSP